MIRLLIYKTHRATLRNTLARILPRRETPPRFSFSITPNSITSDSITQHAITRRPHSSGVRWSSLFPLLALLLLAFPDLARAKCPPLSSTVPTGLVGWWKLDDGSGANAVDSSATANTGAVAGTPTWTTGEINGALQCSSTTSIVNIPYSAAQDIAGSFTVSVWAKPTAISGSSGTQSLFDQDGNGHNDFYLEFDNNTLGFGFHVLGGAFDGINTVATYSNNNWYHIVGVFDHTAQTLNIYVNGVLAKSAAETNLPDTTGTHQTGICTQGGGFGGQIFTGYMDDVRLYNRALGAGEVAALYGEGSEGDIVYNYDYYVPQYCNGTSWVSMAAPLATPSGLIHRWKLDEAPGATTAADSAGSANASKTGASADFTTSGLINNAAIFPNNGLVKYFSVASPADIKSQSKQTISMWFNRATSSSILQTGHFDSVGGTWMGIEVYSDGYIYFDFSATIYGRVAQADTNWHLATMVFDGTQTGNANRLTAYIDGVQQTLGFGGTIPATTPASTSYFIGAVTGSGADTDAGTIDDVRVYSRPLSASDVLALYKGGVHGAGCSSTTMAQKAKITASDAANNHDFGISVSVSGNTLGTGAFGANEAYTFDITSLTSPVQKAHFTGSDTVSGDNFGYSVFVSGTTMVVGAPVKTVSGHTYAGAVYIFDISNLASPVQKAEITDPGAAANDEFGWNVFVSGSLLLVGSPDATVSGNTYSGKVYVYDISTLTSPVLKSTITPAAPVANHYFGYDISMSGTLAVIGGYGGTGDVYVFDLTSPTSPVQKSIINSSDESANDDFGIGVALSGTTLLAGADNRNSGFDGAIYLFDLTSPTSPVQKSEVTLAGGGTQGFGGALALSGTTAVVGNSYQQGTMAGGVYVYDITTLTSPVQTSVVTASDETSADFFGNSVAISGTTMVAGAYGNTSTMQGAGYVFATPPAGNAGDITYNKDNHVPQFCNGLNWQAMGKQWTGSDGGGCTAGQMMYNHAYCVLQYCDSNVWQAIGSPNAPNTCNGACGTPAVGTVCTDGSVYAGLTPDGNVPMYTQQCDIGMTWNGSSCTGSQTQTAWNNGNTTGYVTTNVTNATTGRYNTATLVTLDSDSGTGGTQPHAAAQTCVNLNQDGHTDWYLPSINELTVIHANYTLIGGFDSVFGSSIYWSSTESSNTSAQYYGMVLGTSSTTTKDQAKHVRCVRNNNPPPAKTVFVTSTSYAASFGSVANANADCAARATAAGLAGTYKAWLAVTTGTDDPATTFTHNAGAYVDVKGNTIASNWAGLTSCALTNAINYDETGALVSSNSSTWSNVSCTGTALYSGNDANNNCASWTNATSSDGGGTGNTGSTAVLWTNAGAWTCNQTFRLFCFQQ